MSGFPRDRRTGRSTRLALATPTTPPTRGTDRRRILLAAGPRLLDPPPRRVHRLQLSPTATRAVHDHRLAFGARHRRRPGHAEPFAFRRPAGRLSVVALRP